MELVQDVIEDQIHNKEVLDDFHSETAMLYEPELVYIYPSLNILAINQVVSHIFHHVHVALQKYKAQVNHENPEQLVKLIKYGRVKGNIEKHEKVVKNNKEG